MEKHWLNMWKSELLKKQDVLLGLKRFCQISPGRGVTVVNNPAGVDPCIEPLMSGSRIVITKIHKDPNEC